MNTWEHRTSDVEINTLYAREGRKNPPKLTPVASKGGALSGCPFG
jgi:hypothetical protein